ncbi:hypothetical protein QYE76_036713 [Lolium multiflorum]|uniref:FBD domain-containing protein n=1 Tax=Lolium multiflorum TaxID=4521 RepID=A0AAD8VQ83_LOLMU|nr:hypothetical protein QYE76_036713 [Lolium multiflorum]
MWAPMKLRSGRRLRPYSKQLSPVEVGDGEDHISALPDDLLFLVLGRLRCFGAAVRTGVLSRRWRGLWSRLRQIFLRDAPFHFLETALARVPRPPPKVSLLEIHLPEPHRLASTENLLDTASVNSLLRAAARLDPEELFLVLPSLLRDSLPLELPCFRSATSIMLDLCCIIRRVAAGVEFPALETLSLLNCTANLDALLSGCPRLRTLRLSKVAFHKHVLSVNSPLLQELVVNRARWIKHVNIVAPMLTQLTLSLHTYQELSISILVPMVEKVSWDCSFSWSFSGFGLWQLRRLSLQTAETQGHLPSLYIHGCMSRYTRHDEVGNFKQEIEERLIAAFSVLELHLTTNGHVYGPFMSHVLEINEIRCAIQRLHVDLERPLMEQGCPPDCPCEPTDWKSQTISLTALEEVEISGFGGKDHDFDLLKLILRSAPILKRMTMKLSQEASASNDGGIKVYDIFKAYPTVQCYVRLSSGLMHGSQNCPSI